MELLGAFYRRKFRKKNKKVDLGRSDGALCRSPSETSVNGIATGLITKVLRFTSRRSEPVSRPHSWHSTKLGEGQQDPGVMQLSQATVGTAWHHNYHTSASTTDLSSGFEPGGSYLRKSPDQYSSRGSMESLDPPPAPSIHAGPHHHHGGPHPAYSSCHQLSSARSSNSIDHLHSKRDSAYSSFSTSSSIPEYLAANPSFSQERSYSLETVPQRGGGDMQQADIRYVRTVYDPQLGLSQEHELSSASAAMLRNNDARSGAGQRAGLARDFQGSGGGGVCYRGNSSSSSSSSGSSSGGRVPASNRHSVGPIWAQGASHSSYESLRGAPPPPLRSDSYAAIRNHERPNSWSSLEHSRSLRSLQKGSWHHSSGSVASGKSSFAAEGQLHTVIEKSPESSPTTKPRQGGGLTQPAPPPSAPAGAPPSGRLMLPTGVYPVPQPEPHYAQVPSSSPSPSPSGVYPSLAKESSQHHGLQGGSGGEKGGEEWRDGEVVTVENGYQSNAPLPSSPLPDFPSSSSPTSSIASAQHRSPAQKAERPPQGDDGHGLYRSQVKAAGGSPEVQLETVRPHDHHGHHSQAVPGFLAHHNPGAHIQNLHGHQGQAFPTQQTHVTAGPPNQTPQGQYAQSGSQGPQTPNSQGYQSTQAQLTQSYRPSSQHLEQDRRDPYTPVQQRGESRSPYPHAPARTPQGQAAPAPHHHPVLEAGDPRGPAPLRHHSDSAALQLHYWDPREEERERAREREQQHPLTRLEIALAEVQRCSSPDSTVSTASSQGRNGHHGNARSLSVLEKVSRFEHRNGGGKQRSHSNCHGNNWTNQCKNPAQDRTKGALCSSEDLRSMLERSTSGSRTHRTMSCRRGSGSDQPQDRNGADPSAALQRSRSTFQLGEAEKEQSDREFPRRGEPSLEESGGEFPWKQDLQNVLGPIQDTSFNSRAYRDSLKDAQSKVLRSTSFRRRDLSVSVSPPPTSTPPPVASPTSHAPAPQNHQPPSPLAKSQSLERKGPKTMPKPQSGFQGPAGVQGHPSSPPAPPVSRHTPKERHVVSPEVRGPSPPALPSVPPVGPPLPARICGRKRLTMEQKKRSFSEPENMHEVGVSDAETTALFRRGGETSVADRRKMFELAASRSLGAGPSQMAVSRPELRQMQQDAVAEYVERKRGKRKEEGGGGRPQRPHSAYLQPGTSSNTASSPFPDTISLCSTSSLLSLQEPCPERLSPGERRLCSTLPPGAGLQTNSFYPGRVTAPRAQAFAHHAPSPHSGSQPEPQRPSSTSHLQDLAQGGELYRPSAVQAPGPWIIPQRAAGPTRSQGLSQPLNGAPDAAGPGRGSGKSASAEDLLERSEERQPYPQHHRSQSSPAVERHYLDVRHGDLRMFGVFATESQPFPLPDNRPTQSQRPASASGVSQPSFSPAPSHPTVTRRDRQRNGDRQRAHSTSTLAASVGLPCPLTSPGTPTGTHPDWHAGERLSQANLDAITFPGMEHHHGDRARTGADAEEASRGSRSSQESPEKDRRVSVERLLAEDPAKDRRLSAETRVGAGAEVTGPTLPKIPSVSPPPPPPPQASPSTGPPPPVCQHLSSLRISESSLPPTDVTPLQAEFDEVFLQEPAPPPTPPPIRETDITDDFPPPPDFLPPPPPVQELAQEHGGAFEHAHRKDSSEYLDTSTLSEMRPSLHPLPPVPSSSSSQSISPVPSLPPVPQPLSAPPTPTPGPEAQEAEPDQGPECQALPRRERSAAELRVEALSRQLVLRDSSLVTLLDTWGGKCTAELMEDIFPAGGTADRSCDGICSTGHAQNQTAGQEMETDLDEEEKDLNTRKVELCRALRQSLACLREEKEILTEEQKQYRALGSTLDTLVQDRCKSNERDKYRSFIGDLEKIVNLLLSLCGRLARIDKALLALGQQEVTEDTAEERDSLHHKRGQLLSQTEDARELKENLDRRQRAVHTILSGYLTAPQLQDYERLVCTSPSLLIRQRHLDDMIRQGEEQLSRLAESLPAELVEASGWPNGCQAPSSPAPSHAPSPGPGHSPSLLPAPSLVTGHNHLVRSTTVTSL